MSLAAINAVTHLAGKAVDTLSNLAESSSSKTSAQRAASALAQGGNAKAMKNLPVADQVKAASAQFEAILLRQFLQESVGGLMGGQDSGSGGNVYGYMLTDVLATKLSEGGGLGLASVLQKQLTPRGMNAAAAEAKGSS
jgi:flagellar protein FlgJ